MKRWYLSRLVGSGTSHADMRRPKAYDLALAAGGSIVVAVPPTSVVGDWSFCLVDVADHSALLADPDVRDLPDAALDAKISTIPTATRTRLTAALTDAGIPTNIVRGTDGYRVVIKAIGQRYNAVFDENAFDVGAG